MIAFARLAALLLVPSLAAAAPASVPTEPGVEWENTVEMQMAGFSMPAQTSKSCVPKKGMTEPPGAGKDDKCKVTRMNNDGRTMSWSMVCEGKDKYSGDGEITQTADGYDGKMTMRTADGEMLMKMRGKKLGTPCDAATIKRQVAAIQAETAASIAEGCRSSAKKMEAWAFTSTGTGAPVMCKDPADISTLCEGAATRRGVSSFLRQPAPTRTDLGILCKTDFSVMKSQACVAAAKEEAATKGVDEASDVLSFIGSTCPAETRVLAQRECAGRYYTGGNTNLSDRYRSFCTSYAANLLDTEPKSAAKEKKPQDPPPDAAQEAAKKAVKSLLPF
jgi:hypothetical protein